ESRSLANLLALLAGIGLLLLPGTLDFLAPTGEVQRPGLPPAIRFTPGLIIAGHLRVVLFRSLRHRFGGLPAAQSPQRCRRDHRIGIRPGPRRGHCITSRTTPAWHQSTPR